MLRRWTLPLALLTSTVLAAPAVAQSWQMLDEIDFAQSMARYRLFDIASEYLNELGEDPDLSNEDRLSLLYARAVIEKIAGEHAGTPEARREFLGLAIGNYDQFLEQAAEDHDKHQDALKELAEAYKALGTELGEIAEATADQEVRAEAEKSFRKAAEVINKIYNERKEALPDALMALDELDEEERAEKSTELMIEAHEPLYQLASTYYEFAQMYEEGEFNREDYLTKCTEYAEEFVWEMTEDSLLTSQVYYYDGLARLDLNQEDEALARLEMVVDRDLGAPAYIVFNDSLPIAWIREITGIVEDTHLALVRFYNKSGQYDQSEKWAAALTKYYEDFKDRGVERGDSGDEVLAEHGFARYKQGKSDGMKLLEEVANRHSDDQVGALAAGYIAQILEGGDSGGGVIAPSVWITAAESDAKDGRTFDAIEKYHQALAVLDTLADEGERGKLALQSWNNIGRLYRNQRRYVEAALAFEMGVNYPGQKSDEDVRSLGSAWFNCLTMRAKETKSRADKSAKDNAMRKLSGMGLEDMAFLIAKDDFDSARILPDSDVEGKKAAFTEALEKFKDVGKRDPNYDKARVFVARCNAKLGDLEKAVHLLSEFLKYAANPKNDPPPAERKKHVAREIATTEATYYKSTYQAELGRHDEVLETLAEFETAFPNQEGFYPLVNYQRLRSMLAHEPPLVDEAEKLYEAKKDGQLPGEAQYFLARALLDKAKAAADAGDTASATNLYEKGGRFLYEFCESRGFDSFTNLRAAANAYYQIEDWPEAERIYRKLDDVFGKEDHLRKEITEGVRRTLAEILLAQDKFQDAVPLYKELLAMKVFERDRNIMRQAALCFGGRIDIEGGRAKEIGGAGEYVEAITLWDTICERAYTKDTKYDEPGWWEAKCYSIYTRWRARELDPSYQTQAGKLLKNIYATVINLYEVSEQTDLLGGPDWVKRYEYMRGLLQ